MTILLWRRAGLAVERRCRGGTWWRYLPVLPARWARSAHAGTSAHQRSGSYFGGWRLLGACPRPAMAPDVDAGGSGRRRPSQSDEINCVSRQTTSTVGEPPNHALISPSPTKFAGRCEPSGSMTQTGCPSWNWPSPMLVIGAQVDAYRRRTLLCEHTDAKSAPCGQLNTKSDAKAGPPAGPVWCRKEDAR
jgi:hypothetical protein